MYSAARILRSTCGDGSQRGDRRARRDRFEGTDVGPTLIETGDVFITPHGLPYRIQYPLDVSPALEGPPALVEDSSKPQGEEIEWLGMASTPNDFVANPNHKDEVTLI